jgi:hypothetical protein
MHRKPKWLVKVPTGPGAGPYHFALYSVGGRPVVGRPLRRITLVARS